MVVVGSANTDMAIQVPHLPEPGETVSGCPTAVGRGGQAV